MDSSGDSDPSLGVLGQFFQPGIQTGKKDPVRYDFHAVSVT
jgi:hypothetical protein